MRKENVVSANPGEFIGRITRARAAALHASGELLSLQAPNQLDQKRVLRANAKRTALDENNINAGLECKKRAVLQDVTNVFCNNSYRKCFNASKIQGKTNKQARKGNVKTSKVTPYTAEEVQLTQTNLQKEEDQDFEKTEPKSIELTGSINVKGDATLPLDRIKDDSVLYHCVANESTAIPSQTQIPSRIALKVSVPGTSMASSDPDFINIDSDKKDPLLCSLYAPEIYNNLRVAELVRKPCPNFMETIQRDITQSMRGILVDWLVEVSEEYKLVPDTLYLTVYLIDWFLSQNLIERHRLQLVGITCMLIASKYEEICAPRVEEFCFITDNTYTKEEVLKMESQVLKYFGFQLFAPTAKTFLRRFLRAAQASYTSPSIELEYLANYLAELALIDYGFLNFLPSITAASAVFLARWTLDQSCHPWNPTLEHYTAYNTSDLKTTVLALQDLQMNSSSCPLNAIRMKYRQQKFKSVATFSSPKLLETLF